MIFKKGSYAHAQNSVALRAEYFSIFDTMKRRMGEKIRFSLIGVLRGTSQTDITTQINALRAAYQVDYENVGLYLDDGTTPTGHVINNADTWGGIKVAAGPSFINGPWSGQPEYANQRTFYLVLEAETRVDTNETYAWKERLLIKGTGAPKWIYSPQQVGDPQYQILQTSTSFWYIQEGTAVSHGTGYIDPPDPLFPGIEHGDMREVVFETGDDMVWNNELSRIEARQNKSSWKYYMEAVVSQGFSAFTLPGT
jgi:hypothetical protein